MNDDSAAALFASLIDGAAARFAGDSSDAPADGSLEDSFEGTAPPAFAASSPDIAARSAAFLAKRTARLEETRRRIEQAKLAEESAHSFVPLTNSGVRGVRAPQPAPQPRSLTPRPLPPPLYPQRKPLPPHVRDRTVLDRQAEWSRAKAERLRALTAAVAEEERRECTFRPVITEVARAHAGGLPAEVRAALMSPGGAAAGGGGVDEDAIAARRAVDEVVFIRRLALAKSKREEEAARREAVGRVAVAATEGMGAAGAPQFATAARAAAREGVTLRASALAGDVAPGSAAVAATAAVAAPPPAPQASERSPQRRSPPPRGSPTGHRPPPPPVHPGRSLYTSPLPAPAPAAPAAQPSPSVWVVRASSGVVTAKT